MIAPDEFAEVIEKIDNLRGALEIPMPGWISCKSNEA